MDEQEKALAFFRATREETEVRMELALIDQELERFANALLPLMAQVNARVRPVDPPSKPLEISPDLRKYLDFSRLENLAVNQQTLLERRSSLGRTLRTVSPD